MTCVRGHLGYLLVGATARDLRHPLALSIIALFHLQNIIWWKILGETGLLLFSMFQTLCACVPLLNWRSKRCVYWCTSSWLIDTGHLFNPWYCFAIPLCVTYSLSLVTIWCCNLKIVSHESKIDIEQLERKEPGVLLCPWCFYWKQMQNVAHLDFSLVDLEVCMFKGRNLKCSSTLLCPWYFYW